MEYKKHNLFQTTSMYYANDKLNRINPSIIILFDASLSFKFSEHSL